MTSAIRSADTPASDNRLTAGWRQSEGGVFVVLVPVLFDFADDVLVEPTAAQVFQPAAQRFAVRAGAVGVELPSKSIVTCS
jgi:hypothetical protein